VERYLADVGRNLFGMDRRVKEDIINELRTHILDSGNAHPQGVEGVLREMKSPKEIASEYKDLYGYGTVVKVAFLIPIIIVAALSVPMPQYFGPERFDPYAVANLFLLLTVVVIIWASAVAGKQLGMVAGATACVTRFLVLGVALTTGNIVADAGPLNLALFGIASIALVAVGYIPGERKEKWKSREAII